MILQNYWAWRAQTQNTNTTSNITGITGITDMTGTAVTTIMRGTGSSVAAPNNSNNTLSNGVTNATALALVFGSGDTTPTALDYALDTDETTNLTATGTNTFSYASDKMEIVFAYTIRNNSANSITIKEVGIKKQIYTTSISTTVDVLLAREVFSSPITIAAGETKTINYTWTMQ